MTLPDTIGPQNEDIAAQMSIIAQAESRSSNSLFRMATVLDRKPPKEKPQSAPQMIWPVKSGKS